MSEGGDAKKFIEKTVSEHAVVVFSKSTCPYCVRVKKLFGDVRADIFLVEINKRNDMSALQDELNRLTGVRTVSCACDRAGRSNILLIFLAVFALKAPACKYMVDWFLHPSLVCVEYCVVCVHSQL